LTKRERKTYGKLAHLGVVDTEDLGVLAGAQTRPRRQVHGPKDERRDDERPRKSRDGVCELDTELAVVVVCAVTSARLR